MPISFNDLKLNNREPVYQQIIKHFKRNILLGNLSNGEEIPSRRVLAVTLGINPNTVQKIYKQLESENLIETLPNSKSNIIINSNKIEVIRKELTEQQSKEFLHELKSCGLDFKQVIDLIGKTWDDS